MREFSFQLYSARNFPPLKTTLQKLASFGYERVEGYGGIYEDELKIMKDGDHPFSINNQDDRANYRAVGLADMASSHSGRARIPMFH